MALLECPYLQSQVELTVEREQHILDRHPELIPDHIDRIVATLFAPDEVRRSQRFSNARLFSRWFESAHQGKHMVVVVVTDDAPTRRDWVITAYLSRHLSGGSIEWQRS